MSNTVIRVEGLSKLYRLGEVGTGSLAHDVNRWWHRVRGKEDPYLKIGQINDRTKKPGRSSQLAVGSSQKEMGSGQERKGRRELAVGSSQKEMGRGELAVGSGQQATEDSQLTTDDSAKGGSGKLKADDSAQSAAGSANCKLPTDDYVFALKNVSFDVQQGEVLGIIGRNGAGKSTLLKILSRVTVQTTGRIRVKGRIASLLEVGTGFHPELTGRENVYLNGAILGMRKAEIRAKFDEIVDFSGCERYIDTPVKRYSSGMYVRLAFAVAAHLEPEILIVDEVLAVGDAEFQKKCLGKMKDVAGHGRTVIFVSHNMTAVQSLCPRAILMSNGTIEFDGTSVETVRKYLMASGASSNSVAWENPDEAPGSDLVRINAIRAVSLRTDGEDPCLFDMRTPIDVEIAYRVFTRGQFHITLHFINEQGEVVFTSGCRSAAGWLESPVPGEYTVACHVPADLLNEGNYTVRILVVQNGNRVVCERQDVIGFDVKDLTPRGVGSYHGKEPGSVRPMLNWEMIAHSSQSPN
jgi:lipopolysaccharide transport system ATP-binding protein